ncbi:tetratricopeptide repeat protein [Streptomyces sp. 891-h]|uniref:ATP-binding protein n=1 Tax=Streptomyces sp. 891-h TaxID=2720714 RepID=UPI001FA97A86|nr:tetratricopeptide repeat protein [Streptomyces sp. 891-h]
MSGDGDGPSQDSRNDLSGASRDVVQAGNVAGGIHFHQGRGQERTGPTPRQLPAAVHAFVNRTDELRQLKAILTDRSGDRLVVSVHVVAGTAGAGKTSLVLHWAHEVKDHFPDGQLFINLRGYDPGEPVTANQALRRFLGALGVPAERIPQDVDEAASLYRSLLAERRLLIILDNAATVSQVRPLLPGGGNSLVIVTSRSRLAGLAVRDGARHLSLGTLPEQEAVALLRAVTSGYRPEDGEEKLSELSRLCARLPLALRIAAERAASHPHMKIDDLIADLRDESALWDALSTGIDEEAEAVRSVFAWSYRALPEQSARLFRLLGLHPGPEFSLHAAAALAELPPRRTRPLLDDLVGAHLLEQIAPDRFQFHDLLRAFAAHQVQNDESAEQRSIALRRVLEWYLHTAYGAQGWIKPLEPRISPAERTGVVAPLGFSDYDAAVDWSDREHTTLTRLVPTALAAGFDTLAWQLAVVLWDARSPSSSVLDWLETGRAGLEAAERGNEPAVRIRLLNNLGMAYRQCHRFEEGLERHQRARELARAEGLPFDEARSNNLIGLIHLDSRELDPAAEHFERAAAQFRELDETRRVAMALSNIASTMLDAGRLREAEAAVEEALAAHRELNNERSIGNALNILAEVRLEQGDHSAALNAIEEALDIALNLRSHTLEGFWLLTLGDIQRATARLGEALASYQRSAKLHRGLKNRGREALAWRGTGQAYVAMGRHDEAVAFHRQAVTVHAELADTWQRALELDCLAAAVEPQDPGAARAHWAEARECLAAYADPRAVALRTRIGERTAGL